MKWTRSNGETIEMRDMSPSHLSNATKKTQREYFRLSCLAGGQESILRGLKEEAERRKSEHELSVKAEAFAREVALSGASKEEKDRILQRLDFLLS